MKTTAQRIAKYNARMLSSLVDPVLAAVNAAACANFDTYATDFVPKQEQLRVFLAGLGVPTIQIGAYEAFHGELYHLSKVTSGAGLILAAATLCAKWGDAAHLTAPALPTLKAIALALYAVIIP